MFPNFQLTLVGKNKQLFTIRGGSDEAVWGDFKNTKKRSFNEFVCEELLIGVTKMQKDLFLIITFD